jgi:hypothetical protein
MYIPDVRKEVDHGQKSALFQPSSLQLPRLKSLIIWNNTFAGAHVPPVAPVLDALENLPSPKT